MPPKYRPDIDGLRAIEVVCVLIFRAFSTVLQARFIGVDIFLVISDYVSSTIMFESLSQERCRFGEFYGRRVLRIFPALVVVLVVFALFAEEYLQLGKHIVLGAGLMVNFTLWGMWNFTRIRTSISHCVTP